MILGNDVQKLYLQVVMPEPVGRGDNPTVDRGIRHGSPLFYLLDRDQNVVAQLANAQTVDIHAGDNEFMDVNIGVVADVVFLPTEKKDSRGPEFE